MFGLSTLRARIREFECLPPLKTHTIPAALQFAINSKREKAEFKPNSETIQGRSVSQYALCYRLNSNLTPKQHEYARRQQGRSVNQYALCYRLNSNLTPKQYEYASRQQGRPVSQYALCYRLMDCGIEVLFRAGAEFFSLRHNSDQRWGPHGVLLGRKVAGMQC